MKSSFIAAVCFVAGLGTAQAAESLSDLVQSGERAAALELLRVGSDVNEAQGDGTTALHWAVYRNDVELVQALLAHEARVNVSNLFGSSPLAEATNIANPTLVRLLLEAGADPDIRNQDGQTPLMLAARTGVLEVVKLLVSHGADVNAVEQWRGQNALMWAAAGNHAAVARFLIASGADVNLRADAFDWPSQITSEPRAQYRPSGGLTPLLYAARGGCLVCVQAMLEAGADINLPDPDGVSPLMVAIDNKHYDTAAYLLEQGANPHSWDWWGRTPLYVAVDMNSFTSRFGGESGTEGSTHSALDIVRLLLEAGANPNSQLNMHRPGRGGNSGRFSDDLLNSGATALLRAANSHDVEAARLLLAHGALVDLPNTMGVTPFLAAAGMGSSRGLLGGRYGEDVQPRSIAFLELLLEHGADINARILDTTSHTARIARRSSMTNRQGQGALHGAASQGWTEVARFLIEHGADLNAVDDLGKTPLDSALGQAGGRVDRPIEEMVALLERMQKQG